MAPMDLNLNYRAANVVNAVVPRAEGLRVTVSELPGGGRGLDFGAEAEGGLAAGLALARACTADLADVVLQPGEQITTDHPVAACMLSQYAGWQISVGDYFAMGSGPMRAAAAHEELFKKLDYREKPARVVGVLEGRKMPGEDVVDYLCERTGVAMNGLDILLAPTASQAGGLQVVARSVETCLHKLYELGFDLYRIRSAFGTAPLPPVAKDDLSAIGRTNDAILYGGRVVLWVRGDDASLEEIGPKVPSSASPDHGATFSEIFRRYDKDFYKIDPLLFSPAEVVFQNLDTGRSHLFGARHPDVLGDSFYGWGGE
jgi:methenyltetrahydromethanopterin cyclohydrolase